LFVVSDPQGGHHFWSYRTLNFPNDTGSFLDTFKSGLASVYVEPDRLVAFTTGLWIAVYTQQSSGLAAAESASIEEFQRNLPVSKLTPHLTETTVQIHGGPMLVGYKGNVAKALPTFTPVPPEFSCPPYGSKGFSQGGGCPAATIVSISKQSSSIRTSTR
jgi:hypothetical protein